MNILIETYLCDLCYYSLMKNRILKANHFLSISLLGKFLELGDKRKWLTTLSHQELIKGLSYEAHLGLWHDDMDILHIM